MNYSTPPVLIMGCGRSGTSIFGELFGYIGNYTYQSEPLFDLVINADYSHPLAFKVPRESELFPPDPGLPFPLSKLQQSVPKMKYYWTVRHPLDAICSLRVGISNNWGHHPRPFDWREWLSHPIVVQCAHHWAYINSVGFEQMSELVTVVHFETMINNPSKFAISICKSLDLDPIHQSTGINAWSKRVQNTNNAEFNEAETSKRYSRNDHSMRVGRWRENMTKAEVKKVLPLIKDAGNSFGYVLPKAR